MANMPFIRPITSLEAQFISVPLGRQFIKSMNWGLLGGHTAKYAFCPGKYAFHPAKYASGFFQTQQNL